MAFQTFTQTQQSTEAPALPGTWKLVHGRAITLEPREAGVLKVAHGQVWATYEGPHAGALNDMGDHVIGVGQTLVLGAGEKLVIEAWNGRAPAYFSWDPLPAPALAPRFVRVVQPLADLRAALGLAGGAVVRLLAGLAGLAWDVVAPRERGPRGAFDARACTATAKA
jgi:hypothetical protein